jgi:hypothetical protein
MQDSVRVLGFDPERWNHLPGGYEILSIRLLPCENLRANRATPAAWQEMWEELHHPRGTGDALYAAAP